VYSFNRDEDEIFTIEDRRDSLRTTPARARTRSFVFQKADAGVRRPQSLTKLSMRELALEAARRRIVRAPRIC
jgi:hypothetical protein